MTGELIPTGVTFGVGRNSLNDAFSGTAYLNNIQLDSGGNFSAGTGGGGIFSAGTNLYDIFVTTTGEVPVQSVGSGLDLSSGNLTLGGALTGTTTIDAGSSATFSVSGDSGVSNQIRLASYNSSTFPVFLDIGKGVAALYGLSAGTNQARFQVTSAQAKIEYTEGAQTKRFILDTDDFTFEDNIDNRGVVYQAKYHSNYTNRSLVDKEYVDNTVNTGVTYIDSYLHFNAQTALPSPESGRLFFSGTPLFRLMLNTGGTAADWIII